jgi:hypothetical protein
MELDRLAEEEKTAREKEAVEAAFALARASTDEMLEGPPQFESAGSPPSLFPSESDDEPAKRYAEGKAIYKPTPPRMDSASAGHAKYVVADLEAAGIIPDREAFYETHYRPVLRRMVAHVIGIEGPIFDDLLVRRIARAHMFGRAAGRIRETVLAAVERRFPVSVEAQRKIFWPEGANTMALPDFRSGSLDDRDHVDIPLVELAALARGFLAVGAEPSEAAALMARELGLGRLREAARQRFEEAAQLAASQ